MNMSIEEQVKLRKEAERILFEQCQKEPMLIKALVHKKLEYYWLADLYKEMKKFLPHDQIVERLGFDPTENGC